MSGKPTTSEESTMSVEAEMRLTTEIMDDLVEKVALFNTRSAEEQHKIVIFTDDADLWTSYKTPSIRVGPLPPIPQDYEPRKDYNIVQEMSKFLRDYCTRKKYNFGWCLSTRGEPAKPEVHIIMYQQVLNPTELIPIFQLEGTLTDTLDSPSGRGEAPFMSLPASVRASMWRQHHQDSTLSDAHSSVFSISLDTPPPTPGLPKLLPRVPRIILHRPSSDSSLSEPQSSSESYPREREVPDFDAEMVGYLEEDETTTDSEREMTTPSEPSEPSGSSKE